MDNHLRTFSKDQTNCDSLEIIDENKTKHNSKSEYSFRQICQETTLHGIKNVFNKKISLTRRFLWAILCLFMYASFATTLILGFIDLYKYEVDRKISIIHDSQLDFPAVTICNFNLFRNSAIVGTDFEKILYYYTVVGQLGFTDGAPNISQIPDIDGEEYNRVMLKSAHNISEFLIDCTWLSGYKCDARNFSRTLTDSGVCYTFNSLEPVSKSGIWNGLKLRLSVEEDEYSYNFVGGTGFKIILHKPNTIPFTEGDGFTLSPGLAASAAIEYGEELHLPAPYTNRCGSKKLKYFDEYSLANCKMELLTELCIEKCGCSAYYMLDRPNSTKCSMNNLFCSFNIAPDFAACPVPCVTSQYIPNVSYSKFPDKVTTKYLAIMNNITEDYIHKNYVEGNIYFQSLRYERIEEVPALSLTQLGAYVGGLLGLTIGASIITVCEWVDWGFAALFDHFFRRNNNKIS